MRVFALGLVFLGVCVFAWGLRYKLSLYAPPHSLSRRMPAAKLLTGRDRSAIPEIKPSRAVESGTQQAMATFTPVILAIAGYRCRPLFGFSGVNPALRSPGSQSPRSSPTAIRPPPTLL